MTTSGAKASANLGKERWVDSKLAVDRCAKEAERSRAEQRVLLLTVQSIFNARIEQLLCDSSTTVG